MPSLDLYALVDQFQIAITANRCGETRSNMEFLTDKDHVVDLPFVGCALPLATIYGRTQLCR
jgi:GTP-binding protein EngB required for normal cell division